MLEALLEGVLRLVVWILGAIVFNAVFYWPGWLVLKVLTFGRYPPLRAQAHDTAFVAMVGFGICLCIVCIPIARAWPCPHT